MARKSALDRYNLGGLRLTDAALPEFRGSSKRPAVRAGRGWKKDDEERGGGEVAKFMEGREGNAAANERLAALGEAGENRELNAAIREAAIAEAERSRDEAEIGRIRDLAQTVRGTSPAQLEEQQRRVQMEETRDAEKEKRRFRATAEMASLLDQRYGEIREKGEAKIQGKDLSGLPSMVPGWAPTINPDTGKVNAVFVREEPSGEPGSEEMVLAFYEETEDGGRRPLTSGRGEPVRPNRNAMAQLAQMNELDRRERSGIPGRIRKSRAEEGGIDLAQAQAEKARGEGEYYAAGGAQQRPQTFGEKDRAAQLLKVQKEINDLNTQIGEYRDLAGVEPPPGLLDGLQALEDQKRALMSGRAAVVPPPAGAGAGGVVQVNTPEEARALPPGTKFMTPDGREFTR